MNDSPRKKPTQGEQVSRQKRSLVEPYLPAREAQAMREVGHTAVRRSVAIALSIIFLLTIGWTPLVDWAHRVEGDEGGLFLDFASRVAAQLGAVTERGLVAANRGIKEEMDWLEAKLEEGSWLRRRWVPNVQWRLATSLGMGNEQVYIGRNDWLFYRADVDYVVGRGFLDPAVLRARSEAGDLWSTPPQPDPVVAIELFVAEMAERGIRTIIMPTPVKPTVDPEPLIAGAWVGGPSPVGSVAQTAPVQNASFAQFVAHLEAAGVEVFDPAPLLVQAKVDTSEGQYLRTDTHWTPLALDRVIRELAGRIEETTELSTGGSRYRRQPVVLEGFGDIAGMLSLPQEQKRIAPERVETQMVLSPEGTTWRSDRSAEILILGDSFSNVYSDASLGWGSSAGLVEQLSYVLGRPIDKIAVNAGGSRAAREALRRALVEDPDRLAKTRVVVYQFATRELSQGDWRFDPAVP